MRSKETRSSSSPTEEGKCVCGRTAAGANDPGVTQTKAKEDQMQVLYSLRRFSASIVVDGHEKYMAQVSAQIQAGLYFAAICFEITQHCSLHGPSAKASSSTLHMQQSPVVSLPTRPNHNTTRRPNANLPTSEHAYATWEILQLHPLSCESRGKLAPKHHPNSFPLIFFAIFTSRSIGIS